MTPAMDQGIAPCPHPVEISLEEYKSLRQEALTSMGTQQSILSFGTAALGILLAGAFNVFGDALAAALIFLLFVPLLSHLVLVLWMTEVVRMLRAGFFLANIENEISALIGRDGILTWERWAHARPSAEERDKGDIRVVLRDVDRLNFQVVTGLLFSIALAGVAIGNYELMQLEGEHKVLVVSLNLLVLGASIVLGYTAYQVHESGKRLRSERAYLPPARIGDTGEVYPAKLDNQRPGA